MFTVGDTDMFEMIMILLIVTLIRIIIIKKYMSMMMVMRNLCKKLGKNMRGKQHPYALIISHS